MLARRQHADEKLNVIFVLLLLIASHVVYQREEGFLNAEQTGRIYALVMHIKYRIIDNIYDFIGLLQQVG
jgi:hypothetical protein